MDAVRVENLMKYYGRHLGIEDVSFTVKEGEILGFVGPNGAGKSTTIRILLNFIFPSGGTASIYGKDVVTESRVIKGFTGYVPSDVRYYRNLTVGRLIKVSNRFHRGSFDDETERLCDLFELDLTKRFDELSTGNKKKVAIVCALAFKPKVLILDEPTSGLDPVMQKRLFTELTNQAANGVAILLSSHNLGEVQEYCDRVVFIKQGRIVTTADLAEFSQPQKIVMVRGGKEICHSNFQLLEHRRDKRIYRYRGEPGILLELLKQAAPDDVTIANESLDEYFMDLYGQGELK